ncbi:hypothetical protein N0V90_010993 [Kalmusia sp. IMI 367209]|nr:hypothetical protein N0V90_010993 [Kalmusia sp. IMI 367209]
MADELPYRLIDATHACQKYEGPSFFDPPRGHADLKPVHRALCVGYELQALGWKLAADRHWTEATIIYTVVHQMKEAPPGQKDMRLESWTTSEHLAGIFRHCFKWEVHVHVFKTKEDALERKKETIVAGIPGSYWTKVPEAGLDKTGEDPETTLQVSLYSALIYWGKKFINHAIFDGQLWSEANTEKWRIKLEDELKNLDITLEGVLAATDLPKPLDDDTV